MSRNLYRYAMLHRAKLYRNRQPAYVQKLFSTRGRPPSRIVKIFIFGVTWLSLGSCLEHFLGQDESECQVWSRSAYRLAVYKEYTDCWRNKGGMSRKTVFEKIAKHKGHVSHYVDIRHLYSRHRHCFICCCVPNFIKIGWFFAGDITISNMASVRHLGFLWRHNIASGITFSQSQQPTLLNFYVDWFCSFRDTCNIIHGILTE